jgi:tetratricopeptide (TPR) repeat protein
MKTLYGIILSLLIIGITPPAKDYGLTLQRGKTVQVGSTTWYTEQNSFNEIVNIARKENKPIFVYFSASWSQSCKKLNRDIFSKPSFREAAKRTVLFQVEQTAPGADKYLETYNIPGYPSFIIFSKEGAEMERGYPESPSVEGFLKWIGEVARGESFLALARRLKVEPENRLLLMKMVNKINFRDPVVMIRMSRKIIKLNPDTNDPITQEAYESLASAIFIEMFVDQDPYLEKDYAELHSKEFLTVYNYYYPDKFKYILNGGRAFVYIISWYNILDKYDKAYTYFKDFLILRGNHFNFRTDYGVVKEALLSMLHTKREKEALGWLAKVEAYVKQDGAKYIDRKRRERIILVRLRPYYEVFADYYGQQRQLEKAEFYAKRVVDAMDRMKMKFQDRFHFKMIYARKYGLFADDCLKTLDERYNDGSNSSNLVKTCEKAAIYAGMGKKDKAKKLLDNLMETLPHELATDAGAWNRIALTLLNAGIVDTRTLQVAEQSVKIAEHATNLDTLARIHARLGHFNKALKYEAKALELERRATETIQLKRKLALWKKKARKN